jgi:hypothetical protein
MIANGFDVAVLEHHVSSSAGGFTNQYSQARITYYNITGIPRSYFDGITYVSGGGAGTYGSFVTKYNQRIAIPSNFTAAINGSNNGLDYTVALNFENVEPYTGTNLVAHLALSESNLPYGGDVYNYVTRLLVPDANGTPLDFSTSTTQTVILNFSMNPSWVLENCEFIAFIQDNTTKEILQATKINVLDLAPLTTNNAGAVALNAMPVMNCTEQVSPAFTILNDGAEELTSLNINYRVNEEVLNTFEWTGSLMYGETEQVNLPSASFTMQDENDFIIYTSLPNGMPDEDPTNDTLTSSFVPASEMVPDLFVFIKLDNNPEETTWEVFDAEGTVIKSGGPYTEPLAFMKDTVYFDSPGCYTFAIYDEGGDGILDDGFYRLRDGNNDEIVFNTEFWVAEEMLEFANTATGIEDNFAEEAMRIYPNPASEYSNVLFNLTESVQVELNVYSLTGEVIYQESKQNLSPGMNSFTLHTSEFSSGIYFVKLKVGDQITTNKLTVH